MITDNDNVEKWDEETEKDWKEKMSEPIGFDVFSPEEFEKIRLNKVEKRGAFKQKLLLEKVLDDGEY